MTATVTLEIARRDDVVRIPNAALRFRPTPQMFAALNQPVPEELQGGRGAEEVARQQWTRRRGQGPRGPELASAAVLRARIAVRKVAGSAAGTSILRSSAR